MKRTRARNRNRTTAARQPRRKKAVAHPRASLSLRQVYEMLLNLLIDVTGGRLHSTQIAIDSRLRGQLLGFTDQGLRALTARLNSRFHLKLSPGQVERCTTVRDLVNLVSDHLTPATNGPTT
jgi:acyl carrier protein